MLQNLPNTCIHSKVNFITVVGNLTANYRFVNFWPAAEFEFEPRKVPAYFKICDSNIFIYF